MNINCEAVDFPAIKLRLLRQALESIWRKYFSFRIGRRKYRTYISRAMLYLLSFFCSPLALLLSGKPISALFNFILYILSIVCWVTVIFFHVGFILWGMGVLHAVLTIHDARADRRTRRIIAATRQD